jgi:hypothetical protein
MKTQIKSSFLSSPQRSHKLEITPKAGNKTLKTGRRLLVRHDMYVCMYVYVHEIKNKNF